MPIDHQRITIEDDGRLVAEADVHVDVERDLVTADLHVESGPVPTGTRGRLVDAVLELAGRPRTQLDLALPIGDGELLCRLQERLRDAQTRAAGTTCLLRATTT